MHCRKSNFVALGYQQTLPVSVPTRPAVFAIFSLCETLFSLPLGCPDGLSARGVLLVLFRNIQVDQGRVFLHYLPCGGGVDERLVLDGVRVLIHVQAPRFRVLDGFSSRESPD